MLSRATRLLLAVLVCCCTSGCLRIFQTMEINPDRTCRFDIQVEMDRKALAGMLKAMTPDQEVDESKVLDISTPDARTARLAEYISTIDGWNVISLAEVTEPQPDKVVIHVKGYARDFTKLRLFHIDNLPGINPQRLDFDPVLTEEKDGRWTLRRASLANLFPSFEKPAGKKATDAEIEKHVQTLSEAFPQRLASAAPFTKGIECRANLKFGGKVVEANGMRRTGDSSAEWVLSMEKVIEGLTKIIADKDILRAGLKQAEETGTTAAMPPAMLARLNQSVYGEEKGATVVVQPGEPLFDYKTEIAPIVASQPEELARILRIAEDMKRQRPEEDRKKNEGK